MHLCTGCHPHPISYPIPYPIPSYPIPSHPIPSHPISSRPIPSRPARQVSQWIEQRAQTNAVAFHKGLALPLPTPPAGGPQGGRVEGKHLSRGKRMDGKRVDGKRVDGKRVDGKWVDGKRAAVDSAEARGSHEGREDKLAVRPKRSEGKFSARTPVRPRSSRRPSS